MIQGRLEEGRRKMRCKFCSQVNVRNLATITSASGKKRVTELYGCGSCHRVFGAAVWSPFRDEQKENWEYIPDDEAAIYYSNYKMEEQNNDIQRKDT